MHCAPPNHLRPQYLAMGVIVNVRKVDTPTTTRVGLRTLPLFYLRDYSTIDGTTFEVGRHLTAFYETIDPYASNRRIARPLFSGYATTVVNADQYWSYFLVERAETFAPNPIPFLAEPVTPGPVVLAVKNFFYTPTTSDIKWTRALRFSLLVSKIVWPNIDYSQEVDYGSPTFLWEGSIHGTPTALSA
ncbi:hypothetical protein CONPUDRAFT_73778 [Coniophora puteana RWD-64-598 SS2]|uniref:Uncharacterized protein n=1 Tax=Coniophora puteana (strain RWD-64-598) TaxID=741705 RepID=A0A5M3MNW1_CONPW|nr:uncharacterized protein CONPUDRAFT_73778 [Coniophora puteana RWD-64-598 SS2]EIW80717.1 hypothetical protein CONPUDRAFT_73778 [Coniophora puteana RWD-64-598 SS2]